MLVQAYITVMQLFQNTSETSVSKFNTFLVEFVAIFLVPDLFNAPFSRYTRGGEQETQAARTSDTTFEDKSL